MTKATARIPNDPLLELDVLASCLARPDMILTLGVSEEDFAFDSHRLVWRVMQDLQEVGEPVDLVRIRSRLLDSDNLKQVGGEEFLAKIRATPPLKALPVERLKQLTKYRSIRAAAELVASAVTSKDPAMVSAAIDGVQEAAGESLSPARPKNARELSEAWMTSLEQDPSVGRVSPGIAPLKRVLGWLDVGSLTIIGAPPNVGKSTVCLEMLLGAILDGEKAGYLSFEDPESIVVQRIISILSGLSPKRVRKFRPGDPDGVLIDKAMKVMHALHDRLQVSDCSGMNEAEALEQMTLMAKNGARLIIADYLGVVQCSVKKQDRRNEIAYILTRFKTRAKRLGCALVFASQLSRPKDNDPSKKPTLHSFREAGEIEQMAEYAVLMWRKVQDDFAPVYCELAKSKTGNLGYSWTMQRETEAIDEYGNVIPNVPGSGRLVEVTHDDEPVFDDEGNRIWVRPVMPDPTGNNRWRVEESSR